MHKLRKSCRHKRNINRIHNEKLHYKFLEQGNKKIKLQPITQSSRRKFNFTVILLKGKLKFYFKSSEVRKYPVKNSQYILHTIVEHDDTSSSLKNKTHRIRQRNTTDKDNSLGELGVATIRLGPINTERFVWDKTNIVDEEVQNIEDLINNVITQHQEDNSKQTDEKSDLLDQYLQDYLQLENAAPPEAEKLAEIIKNIRQGFMRKKQFKSINS